MEYLIMFTIHNCIVSTDFGLQKHCLFNFSNYEIYVVVFIPLFTRNF